MGEFIKALQQSLEMPDLHFVQISDERNEQAMIANGAPEDVAKLFIQMSALERTPEKIYGDFSNHPTTVGTFKFADFLQKFAQAYKDSDPIEKSETLIDK